LFLLAEAIGLALFADRMPQSLLANQIKLFHPSQMAARILSPFFWHTVNRITDRKSPVALYGQ